MTETTELLDAPATTGRSSKTGGGLSGMVLADLKALAGQLGIKGTSGMRKSDLVAAISTRQNGGNAHGAESTPVAAPTLTTPASNGELPLDLPPAQRRRRAASRPAGAPEGPSAAETPSVNGVNGRRRRRTAHRVRPGRVGAGRHCDRR